MSVPSLRKGSLIHPQLAENPEVVRQLVSGEGLAPWINLMLTSQGGGVPWQGLPEDTTMPATTEANALTSVGDFTGLGQQQEPEFNPLQDTLLGTRSSNITFR